MKLPPAPGATRDGEPPSQPQWGTTRSDRPPGRRTRRRCMSVHCRTGSGTSRGAHRDRTGDRALPPCIRRRTSLVRRLSPACRTEPPRRTSHPRLVRDQLEQSREKMGEAVATPHVEMLSTRISTDRRSRAAATVAPRIGHGQRRGYNAGRLRRVDTTCDVQRLRIARDRCFESSRSGSSRIRAKHTSRSHLSVVQADWNCGARESTRPQDGNWWHVDASGEVCCRIDCDLRPYMKYVEEPAKGVRGDDDDQSDRDGRGSYLDNSASRCADAAPLARLSSCPGRVGAPTEHRCRWTRTAARPVHIHHPPIGSDR